MKVSFVKVQIEEAGKALAVYSDGLMTDYMIYSNNDSHAIKKYVAHHWQSVESFDSLAKAKTFVKNSL